MLNNGLIPHEAVYDDKKKKKLSPWQTVATLKNPEYKTFLHVGVYYKITRS